MNEGGTEQDRPPETRPSGFWASEYLVRRQEEAVEGQKLIHPFIEGRVKHGAYELALGQVYISGKELPEHVDDGKMVSIPEGKFALLLTTEVVRVPPDAIALISMKAGVKFRGLVNVSGFHVDPGWNGRLLYSVYNAGVDAIPLTIGDPLFLIWYASLTNTTDDTYNGVHQRQNQITSEHIATANRLSMSTAELDKKLGSIHEDLRKTIKESSDALKTKISDLKGTVEKLADSFHGIDKSNALISQVIRIGMWAVSVIVAAAFLGPIGHCAYERVWGAEEAHEEISANDGTSRRDERDPIDSIEESGTPNPSEATPADRPEGPTDAP